MVNYIEEDHMSWTCSTQGEIKKIIHNFSRNMSREELDRPGRRWEDNIETYLIEVVCGIFDGTQLA